MGLFSIFWLGVPAALALWPGSVACQAEAREGWWARQDSNLQPDRYERPERGLGSCENPYFPSILITFVSRCSTRFCGVAVAVGRRLGLAVILSTASDRKSG